MPIHTFISNGQGRYKTTIYLYCNAGTYPGYFYGGGGSTNLNDLNSTTYLDTYLITYERPILLYNLIEKYSIKL